MSQSRNPPEVAEGRASDETPSFFRPAFWRGGIVIGLNLPEDIRAQEPGYVANQVFKTDLVNLPGQEAIIYASEWPPAAAPA
jgi:hypothetical protein